MKNHGKLEASFKDARVECIFVSDFAAKDGPALEHLGQLVRSGHWA